MATQTLEWASTAKLECAGCSPADVYLCVNPEKIAQKDCAEGAEDPTTDFEWKAIEASILSYTSCKSTEGCGGCYYRYLISYDDDQLVEDAVLLTSDIYSALCKGCLTDWALSMMGNDVSVEDDGEGHYTVVNQHGCRFNITGGEGGGYSFSVDADSGTPEVIANGATLSIEGGLGVETDVSATDTITIDVSLSVDSGNIAIFGGDGGLYVPSLNCVAVTACLTEMFTVAGDAGSDQPIAYGNTLAIVGGASVATTGSATDTITVDLELSADADNAAMFGTDGNIYVSQNAVDYSFYVQGDTGSPEEINDEETLVVAGGQCLSSVSSSIDTLTIDLDISTDANNALVVGTDGGALVNPVSTDADNILVNGTDEGAYLDCDTVSDCLTEVMSLAADVGTPETVAYGDTVSLLGGASIETTVSATDTVTVDLLLSADANNIATFGTDGDLYVPAGGYTFDVDGDSGTPQTIANGNTLNIIGRQAVVTEVSATDTVEIDVEISADADNGIIIGTDGGLYAPAGAAADTPAGSIVMYGGAAAPSGWSLCNGAAVSRAGFAALFAIVGETFGVGDGVTTFNLPDLRQRFPLGKAASGTGVTLGSTGGSIDHTHTVPAHYHGVGTGADIAISSSGSHLHAIDHNHPPSPTLSDGDHNHFTVKNITDSSNTALSSSTSIARSSTVYDPYTLHGGASNPTFGLTSTGGAHTHTFDMPAYVGNSTSVAHTHITGDFTGRIGLVTGGVSGNAAMTSGTQNPPYQTVNFIIKE